MAFTYHIDNIQSTPNSISVTVTYADSATGFNLQRVVEFPDDGMIKIAQAQAQIVAIGQIYKSSLVVQNQLKALIGSTGTI